MTNLKNEFTKTTAARIQSFKVWSILLVFVLVATSAGAALAYNSDAIGHTFDSTFTKWVTYWPPTPSQDTPVNMEGVVDGDVGPGTYVGEAISVSPGGNNTTILEAFYHFNGSKHAFTAYVIVTQNDLTGTATITGTVIEGWLKGASVSGEYNVLNPCPINTPGNIFPVCFQGALHVRVPK